MKNVTTEAARLERTFDWMVVFIAICLFMKVTHAVVLTTPFQHKRKRKMQYYMW